MNKVNKNRTNLLIDIFPEEISNANDPFNEYGNLGEEVLQVDIEQEVNSLKIAILSFSLAVNDSEFECVLTRMYPKGFKKCSGVLTDDSLFINDISIKSWEDLERVWKVSQ